MAIMVYSLLWSCRIYIIHRNKSQEPPSRASRLRAEDLQGRFGPFLERLLRPCVIGALQIRMSVLFIYLFIYCLIYYYYYYYLCFFVVGGAYKILKL